MIVSGELEDFWIYIVGPLIGALLAAFVAAYALRAFQMEQTTTTTSPQARSADRERRVEPSLEVVVGYPPL